MEDTHLDNQVDYMREASDSRVCTNMIAEVELEVRHEGVVVACIIANNAQDLKEEHSA